MSKLLFAEFNWATAWPALLLLVLLVAYIVYMIVARRKSDAKTAEMMESLKVGDKVVTNSGIYGEIVSITQTTLGKVMVLKTGEGKNISYISVNSMVILGKDEKEDIVYDKDGNPLNMPTTNKLGKKVDEKKEENTNLEANKDLVQDSKEKVENKTVTDTTTPKKPSTIKKTTTKKSTTQKTTKKD